MPYLTDLTLEQLRTSTKTQILTSMRDWLNVHYPTRLDLIRFLIDRETVADVSICTYYPDGQIKRVIDVDRDPETGARLGGRVMDWDYNPDGSVRIIQVSTRDANNEEISCYRIHHNGYPRITGCGE